MTEKTLVFLGEEYVRNHKSGYYFKRTTRNSERKNARQLHRAVWEHYNGTIPDGYQIHHKDFDVDNNDISNLECLPAKEHLKLHAARNKTNPHYVEKQAKSIAKAGEAAKEWHRSAEGRAWHRKHAEESVCKVAEHRTEKKCAFCGGSFGALPWQKYCSQRCREKERLIKERKFVPHERICEMCGAVYIANKTNAKYCSSKCKAAHMRESRRLMRNDYHMAGL